MKRLLLLGTFLLVSFSLFAADFPKPSGWVNDFAKVIDPLSKEKLVDLLTRLEASSGIEMAVVTVPSLEGEDVEGYAVRLFQKWGIGKKGENRGLLVLAAIGDRSGRIEVGYGLEEAINDAYAGRVLRDAIFPFFREGKYGEGLLKGVETLITRLTESYHFSLDGLNPRHLPEARRSRISWLFPLLFFIFFIIMWIRHPVLMTFLVASSGRGGFGGSWGGGGGFGGGFGGFGGGLSGGGGASGRW